MNFKELLSRITGFSTPVFGLSWEPPEPEIRTARNVIRFMEDRRVLYTPYHEQTSVDYCVQSVIEIRRFLTAELGHLPDTGQLTEHLQAMRATCRKFLGTVQKAERDIIIESRSMRDPELWNFFSALGELRGSIGLHLAAIAVMHGLEIQGELVNILPPPIVDET